MNTEDVIRTLRDKRLARVMLAEVFPDSAGDLDKLLRMVHGGESLEELGPLPPIGKWLRLYRRHRRLLVRCVSTLLEEGVKFVGVPDSGDPLGAAENQFFMRVWLPCWMLYGEHPPRLMRRARQGDMNALQDLLRLQWPNETDWCHIGI